MARVVHFVACAAFVASCGSSKDGAAVRTVESSRVVGDAAVDFHRGDSTADRFGLGASPHGSAAGKAPEASAESKSPIAWTTPAGWTELAPTAMRTANFHPGGDPHADCYLTLLGGDGGGLGANVNRWRAQLSLPALSPSEIDALPRRAFVGGDAVFVEATGTWRGMNGTDSNVGWALAGLLHVDPNGSAFLKMTGPESVVSAQRDAFLQLARSFRSANAEVHGDEVRFAPSGAAAGDDHGSRSSSGTFVYEIPAGWRKAPERPMRDASFYAGAGEDLECYVTVFPGEAGGILANVNRWRGQLGEPAIAEADLAALHRIPMLGREAVLVECTGKGSQLVGAACAGADRSVFVKMSGPPERVQEQRSAFLEFCASIRSGN